MQKNIEFGQFGQNGRSIINEQKPREEEARNERRGGGQMADGIGYDGARTETSETTTTETNGRAHLSKGPGGRWNSQVSN